MILKRAFLVGQPNARFRLRGQDYEYNFKNMFQTNMETGKTREIRPPYGLRAPTQPLLPPGPMVIITVPAGSAGTIIEIKDPHNLGQIIQVSVPGRAKPGQKMAVPIPEKGEDVAAVQKRQQQWSTGGKVVAVGAVTGAAVGGALLGDHLMGGTMATDATGTIADAVAPHAEAAGEWVVDAAEDVGDWAAEAGADIGDWAAGAGEDIGDWAAGAGDDIADWAPSAAEDVGDWLGDAAEDTGDWVMDLF